MPAFAYVARDPNGQKVEGVLDTPDTNALAETLGAQGLMLVRAHARTADATSQVADGGTSFFEPRIEAVDLVLFCRQLATLLRAGVPLLRSLKGLEESAGKPRFARVLVSLQQQLESGREFSASMKNEGTVFSGYIVSMVRVGELTGRLPDVFAGLARQLSFERDNREQVRAALRYPLFVLAVAFAAIVAVNIFVIPAFAKVYRGLNAELPLLTKILMGVSDFALAYWPLILAALAGLIGFTVSFLRTRTGRRWFDALLLRLPIIGPLVHKAALARFTKSFGLALDSGVPAVDALTAALETADNVILAERIAAMRVSAERGESLARAARASGVFTPTILQMIAVGEETGALGEMMNEVADHYQKEVDYSIKGLASQIEPILILVLGSIILVFALGVFLPLWDLSRVAMKH